MWKRILKRLGRSSIGVLVGGLTVIATQSPYAWAMVPIVAALGKWARERGIKEVPF